MKVERVTLHFKPGCEPRALSGVANVTFSEGQAFSDLHYIVREGMHVVNYINPITSKREGTSFPVTNVEQVNTTL